MKASPFKNTDALGFLIIRSGRAMIKNFRRRFSENHPEIPVEYWGILVHLWKQDGRSQQDLANEVFKDKATITRALAVLEKLNVIVKIPDEHDKRHKKIYLTHKGRQLEEELSPQVLVGNAEATAGISDEELQICKKVLRKVYDNLMD